MPRILIVDDSKDIHEDFKLIFHSEPHDDQDDDLYEIFDFMVDTSQLLDNKYQFELDFAFQGKDALKLVDNAYKSEAPYSIIFMDVRMPPGWNGVETIRQIWKQYPETEMVLCTAYSDFSWEEIIQTLGYSHHLSILKKPYDRMEVKQLALSSIIKSEYLGKYQARIAELEQSVNRLTKELEKPTDQIKP